ncbi:MAG: hypothetical protein ABH842_00540 [Candidatus Micrarchaeota archaeon]
MRCYSWNGIYFHIKKLVIKIGTSCVVENGQFNYGIARGLVKQICDLKSKGIAVVLVVSGAAALASGTTSKRLLAAKGSQLLFNNYSKLFSEYGFESFTALLHIDDLVDTELKNNLHYLASAEKIICLVNENDFAKQNTTNNDILAAEIAKTIESDCLVLLSPVDGFLDHNGVRINYVDSIAKVKSMVREHKSENGTGGMKTKLHAFERCGCMGVLANGRHSNTLQRILSGEDVGSLFVVKEEKND